MATVEQERQEREEVFAFLDGLGWKNWRLSIDQVAELLDRLLPQEIPVEVSDEEVDPHQVPEHASPEAREFLAFIVE